ncbi:type VII secretion protein EccB [Mycolicibacterium rutilum]|uniref:Type VII secretion protein EccB n=1 Tax=Mycolicibacterium rutilum TaxID=370526 RepID=A0A1H6LDD3_MYCRU|nr:type VII secretion protein EccB [Mycolicibacterium rutilum]SEH82425.1 type VII secretion protein EccB [Mycolicibacterium rutilum]
MPAQVTTRAQVNGYRFLIRRLEHALIRGDSRMIHDPMRGQMRALIVGVVIAVLITGACGVLAFFKPAPSVGDAQILLSKSSGAVFVKIGDRVHPVLNLASARLIVGANENPKEVDDKFLNPLPRGAMVGIVGAPTSIRGADNTAMSSWTVCDNLQTPGVTQVTGTVTRQTAVLANDPVLDGDVRAAEVNEAVLTEAGGTTFLIYDGVRAPLDMSNPAVLNGLHLQGATPRPVSPGLLNAFPLVEPITAVTIDGVGGPSAAMGPQHPVGSMVRTVDSRGEQLFVVLRDGLQPVSSATADIIRYGNPDSAGDARDIAPASLAAVPIVHHLAVEHYPAVPPRIVGADTDRVVCMGWQRSNTAGDATVRLLLGHRLPVPVDAQPVRLASADGNGPAVDVVYLAPGHGEYVQATGTLPDSQSAGQLFYISDTGLRYHIKDLPTAESLGVTGVRLPDGPPNAPQRAPWPVLSLLPAGPALSQEAALIAHDGLAADPASAPVQLPN